MKFDQLDLHSKVLLQLKVLNFEVPTAVQQLVTPEVLKGRDLVVLSPTGSGKTAAYAIPLISEALRDDTTSLILVPTRELASQVNLVLKSFIGNSPVRTALLVGGVSTSPQQKQLRSRPNVIVGTPGRVLYFSGMNLISNVKVLVLDEVDRMLEIGFRRDLDSIIRRLEGRSQTLFFSATLPKSMTEISALYLRGPVEIDLSTVDKSPDTLTQFHLYPKSLEQKDRMLFEKLRSDPGLKLVFTNRKNDTKVLSKKLTLNSIPNKFFNGGLSQSKRTQTLREFSDGQFRVLICTDLASRGLDIEGVTCVINYNLPNTSHDYMHRVGRTGRNGKTGVAVNLISQAERPTWESILKFRDTNETTFYKKKRKWR